MDGTQVPGEQAVALVAFPVVGSAGVAAPVVTAAVGAPPRGAEMPNAG